MGYYATMNMKLVSSFCCFLLLSSSLVSSFPLAAADHAEDPALTTVAAVAKDKAKANTQSLPATITLAIDSTQNNVRAMTLHPIAEQIAQRLGVKLTLYPCPWARCLKAVEKGRVDLIFSVFQTPERDSFMHFIQPALAQHPVDFFFWIHKDRPVQIETYDDLAALSLVKLRGNQYFPRFDHDDNLSKTETVDYQSAVNMVLNKRVDAMIDLSLTPEAQKAAADPNNLLVRADFVEKESVNEYIAISKHSVWGPYHKEVSRVLEDIANEGIIAKYLEQIKARESQ